MAVFIHDRILTIDGPSGTGKSSVARAVAGKLYYTYLDTGAMYRAVAHVCTQQGIAPDADTAQVEQVLEKLSIQLLPLQPGEEDVRVRINGEEVGPALRTREMGLLASQFSKLAVVRDRLTRLQQKIGKPGRVVAEGRDTGSVVFPNAAWKVYLDATPEVRAGRRAAQLRARGEQVSDAQVLEELAERDKADQERSLAPLTVADRAVVVDTSDKSLEEVIGIVYHYVLDVTACPGQP
ncbi:MAG: (d)CMP kinase [Desulfobulbus sp.]|jgi:cytidylate kinase